MSWGSSQASEARDVMLPPPMDTAPLRTDFILFFQCLRVSVPCAVFFFFFCLSFSFFLFFFLSLSF